MKHKMLISFLTMAIGLTALNAQTTAVPDFIFEDYLETHAEDGTIVTIGDATSMGDGIGGNGLVLTNRINEVVLLDLSNLGISDLTGIEGFIALENLFCSNNNLSTLNILNNFNLTTLLCGSNDLTDLDVTNNSNLETLNCSDNQIQSLSLTTNTALKSLTASGNQLQIIDVSTNTNLSFLGVSDNRLTGELIVSNNTHLESLFCASNQISTLNLASNTLLKNLDASDNALTSLDLSAINSEVCPDPQTDPITICQDLSTINVSRNQLTALVVNNGFNALISSLNASDNPDLFCIQIDADFTPSGWVKDDWAYYSENVCLDIFTYVPDDNFEQALIDLGFDAILDNLVLTENINDILSLNVSNKSISSLIGIEDFTALESLDCSNNSIENLDLLNNTALLQLEVSNNDLSALDVSANTDLTAVSCQNNALDSLDLSTNVALTILNCSNNELTDLDIGSNLILSDLDIAFNQIERLDVTGNTALTRVLCNDNNLFALNIDNGNNDAINTFNATNNLNLFCIEVDNVPFANTAVGWQKDTTATYNLNCGTYIPDDNFEQALIDLGIDSDNILNNFVPTADINTLLSLNIAGLGIKDLTGIEDFEALQVLTCSNNDLTILNLSNNTDLQTLDCSENQIVDLDLTANIALVSVLCNTNALRTLNIKNNNNGALATFDATNNPNLYCINVDDAIVGNVPIVWQIDAVASYNGDCNTNRITSIPDAFFEQALIDLGYDDILDAQVLTANIEQIQNLNVSDKSIADLTGIQDFRSLIELDCSGNFLDALDVSDMLFLERLNCGSNNLLTNDINDVIGLLNTTGTISLRALFCAGNNLNNLDTSQNLNLEILDCSNNNLSVLNINGNTFLRILNCSNNDLLNLDISNNIALEEMNCNSNQISDLFTIGTNNTTLTALSCSNNNLANIEVANYEALASLSCGSNELTQLNVTSNINLSFLSMTTNQITDINLLNNTNLIEAQLAQNSLSELEIATNTLLEILNCDFNDITSLQISANPMLQLLSCSSNQLTELNLNNNTNLIEVNVSSNRLTSLMLSNTLGALKTLNASNNQIGGDLDLTTMAISACISQPNQTEFCPETITINVSNNLLSFVNIQNGINADIANFSASGNPNLSCIQVDDANIIGANWTKDASTTYNEDCNFGETFVPDDNFEQVLIDLGYDFGPLNDFVLTANIEALTSLDVSGNEIADLTGIEDFIALETLNCAGNSISELDLTLNVNLINLNCSNNLIEDLELENNTDLTTLDCSDNIITSLNLSANTSLTNLNISRNSFTTFSPREILSLQIFNGDNNDLVELDFQQNQLLTNLSCQFNQLVTLNIRNGQNANLSDLNAQDNPDLICIQTDDGAIPNGVNWSVDATAQFAVNCFFGQTFVPDDNFEQALIDLGYDSGPLDDYVFTDNIEAVNFLNIAGREISDLTGIEAFISLTSLDFSENVIATVNLNNNVLLVNLEASSNLLSDLNLSPLSNLTRLNVSGNSLASLNFDANLNLVDLNVSSNLLSSLELDGLVNLEELNCASNQLSSINVTQNSNLTLLFCQSNLLIADQLNLQNGNNENLQLFNASNNPDLACILVDDPVAIFSNENGLYDNWLKDDTASYQTICEDADNDGVPNEDDLCPTTAFGASVDLFGCALINLPNDNFSISITGETCLNSNNGKITITTEEIYSYTVTLIGEDILEGIGAVFQQDYNFTNDVDILNLLAGTYDMCITIEEWPDYQMCYTIVITQPDPLEVFSSRIASGNELSLIMTGNSIYHIEFNGETFTTYNPIISLDLQQGVNTLKVSTDLECQGVYEEKILVADGAFVYPNPFRNQITIYTDNKEEGVTVKMYSLFGKLVLNKTFKDQSTINVDTNNMSSGIYLMTLQSKTTREAYKIIKE